jgi:hypothetical protein
VFLKLGPIARVFDSDPQEFPNGFDSDITLVDVSTHIKPGSNQGKGDQKVEWLDQQEWLGIKYNTTRLRLLDERSREAKSIGIVDSHCQVNMPHPRQVDPYNEPITNRAADGWSGHFPLTARVQETNTSE